MLYFAVGFVTGAAAIVGGTFTLFAALFIVTDGFRR
jgi:hypothetical protein